MVSWSGYENNWQRLRNEVRQIKQNLEHEFILNILQMIKSANKMISANGISRKHYSLKKVFMVVAMMYKVILKYVKHEFIWFNIIHEYV